MRLDLHQLIELILLEPVVVRLGIDRENIGLEARDYRRIVFVRRKRILRTLCVRILDHPEKRFFFLLAVDDELRAEDFVPAMLGIDLPEHHELGVGGIASGFLEAVGEIGHLLFGNGKADLFVRFADGVDALGKHIVSAPFARFVDVEKVGNVGVDAFGHLVVKRGETLLRKRRGSAETNAALDAENRLKPAITENVGRFRAPGGDRALAGGDEKVGAAANPLGVEQGGGPLELAGIRTALRLLNRVNPLGIDFNGGRRRIEPDDRVFERIHAER